MEHGINCNSVNTPNRGPILTFSVKKTINSAADIGLTDEYITAFKPRAYVKFWTRYVIVFTCVGCDINLVT